MLLIRIAFACAVFVSLVNAPTAFAAECKCKQHDASASGDSACSRTETSSHCTISYGASAEARQQIRTLFSEGVIPGSLDGLQAMQSLIGPVTNPIDGAYRSLNMLGRTPSSVDVFRQAQDPATFFNTVLMVNFALSATAQEETREAFSVAMAEFFEAGEGENISFLDAFTTGNKTDANFGNSALFVNFGCALLTYGQDKNTIVIASEDGTNNCE